MTKITSAYNFVPLQHKVVQPGWQDATSQDVPLQDGLCAEIDIRIVNDTPLLVGGERQARRQGAPTTVSFSTHPDGRPVIPGSSMRGMLRNVLEIASAGRMDRIDDRRLSVRDLDNKELYNRHFTKSEGQHPVKGPVKVTPLTRTAWMRFHEGKWRLCHVPHVRVEQDDLRDKLGLDLKGWWNRSGQVRAPRAKYEEVLRVWRQQTGVKPFQLYFSIAQARMEGEHNHQRGTLSIAYRKVRDVHWNLVSGCADGRLVVTGQPSAGKHMEFIFQVPSADPAKWMPLEERLVQDFLGIHDTPETVLAWFRDEKPFGPEIGFPVFYLCQSEPGQSPKAKAERSEDILAIGLSQMFRLPYLHTVGEVARRGQGDVMAGRLDFVRTLFGTTADEAAAVADVAGATGLARRGRVSFGDCRLADTTPPPWEAAADFSKPTVLNGPKPSYYPNYIVQAEVNGELRRDRQGQGYSTLMDDQARLRGWKRYPVHAPSQVSGVPPAPERSKPDVQTILKPLRPGLTFTGRIRLHNVTREELGAMLWALSWGGNSSLRHSLGMGKPLGFGQVAVEVQHLAVRANDPAASAAQDASSYMQDFTRWMEGQLPQWQKALEELLAMADPRRADAAHLRPLRLGMGRDNQFKSAKQAGSVLQPYSRLARKPQQ